MAQPILPNPFVVLARSDHPLAGVKSVPFSRFAQEPLLVREPGSGTRAVAERVFAERGLAPRVRMELGSNEAIKEAILAGLGVAILARYSIGFDLDPQELAVLDVEGFPIESHTGTSSIQRGKHLSPAARAFCQLVRVETKGLLGSVVPSRGGRATRARDDAPRSPGR